MLVMTLVSSTDLYSSGSQSFESITDAINEATKHSFGYSTFGYWKLFDTEEAAALLDSHVSLSSSRKVDLT